MVVTEPGAVHGLPHRVGASHVCLCWTARGLELRSSAACVATRAQHQRSRRAKGACSEEPKDSSASDQAEYEKEKESKEERLLEVSLEACGGPHTATSSPGAGHTGFLSGVNAPSSRSVPSVATAQ